LTRFDSMIQFQFQFQFFTLNLKISDKTKSRGVDCDRALEFVSFFSSFFLSASLDSFVDFT